MLADKIVLITGATSGIGAETARLLSERGAVPIVTGRNARRLSEVCSGLSGRHGSYKLDVTDDREVTWVIEQAKAEFGTIDILLNNAGYGHFELFSEAPVERFAEMMDTNYMGIVRCTKAVLPIMLARGAGHIVNVASMAGKISTPKASGYAATKHAVLGLTNAMRTELAPLGIAVTAINPGPIDTPFLELADPGGAYAENLKGFMLSTGKVAGRIVRAMERRTPEVDLPWSAALGIRLYGLFPRLADRAAGRWLNRK